MTANAMPHDREQCLAAGMEGYISKPVQVDELVRALSECQPLAGRAGSPFPETSLRPAHAMAGSDEVAVVAASIINTETLDNLRAMAGENGPEVVGELIDVFAEDTSRLLQAMYQALASGNAPGLQQAAHTLKSSSAIFGATALANLCQQLEAQGREGVLEGAAAKVGQAEELYHHVQNALTVERQKA
jgi:HPt (histidine-containing phosphotransfer) domain-containing protein